MMYVQDYDERLPDTYFGRGTDQPTAWNAVIFPYVMNTQVFRCPSAAWGSDVLHPTHGFISGGYGATREVLGYNGSLGYNATDWAGDPNLTASGLGQPIADMTQPANNILVIDATYWHIRRDYWERTDNASSPTVAIANFYNNAYYLVDSRHNEMANAAYADGHVKTIRRGLQDVPRPHSNPIAGAGQWRSYHFH